MDKQRFDVLCRALKKLELDSYEKIAYLPVFYGLQLEDFQDKDKFFERVKNLDFLLFTGYPADETGNPTDEEIPGGIVLFEEDSKIVGFYIVPELDELLPLFFDIALHKMGPSTIWLTGVQSKWLEELLCEKRFKRTQTEPFVVWSKSQWLMPSAN